MKRILVIVHQETSDPGLVGWMLREQGYTLDLRCPAIGHALPTTMEGYAGAIVFGGPMSANDDQTMPFIRTELDWIPIALESGKPYLGICLGAQLLARVLGGEVAPHPKEIREIGYVPIQPTLQSDNPLASLSHVYHWHSEGFSIPSDAVRLATGPYFPIKHSAMVNLPTGYSFILRLPET
ncbi:glutamine amidotransferase-related protein [Egbenema bharatensis]|uniref:glutamine amidotransferase-related protein n=1 Tax=Egbenema bharatensis TaxID=3463334 RepID=UPI003A85A000